MIAITVLLVLFISLFIRECKLDRIRYREQDRLGDEHILREIEKFKKENGIK
jgi:hypothetical protein